MWVYRHPARGALGALVRARRLELGLSQARLAVRVSRDAPFVSKIETRWRAPREHNLLRLAVALQVDVSALLAARAATRSSRPAWIDR